MPGFRNRLVLEMARGVKGFLSLEAGLTRGVVPSIEALEAKIQEQKNKLSLSREQLARRDQKIEERGRHLERLREQLSKRDQKIGEQDRQLEHLKERLQPRKANRVNVFRGLLGLLPPGRLLDLACGHGKFSLVARDLGWEVTAVDVRTSRMPKASGIEWVQSDIREFEVDQDSYDCISVLGPLYHLDLGDQLSLLRKCAGTPTIVDTHVTRRTDYEESGYRDTLFNEVPNATPEEHDDIPTASWKNRTSFWPTKESLLRMFHDSGFPRVFQLTPPHQTGRTFYLCFGDMENTEKAESERGGGAIVAG